MKSKVAHDFRICPAFPLLEVVNQRSALSPKHKIANHRRSARKSRSCSSVKVVNRVSSHKWQLHVSVRVDAARDDETIRRVDHLSFSLDTEFYDKIDFF